MDALGTDITGNKKQMTPSNNQPALCTVRFQYARKKTKHGENKRFQASRWENNMKLEHVYHQKWKINDSKPMDGKAPGGVKFNSLIISKSPKWHQDISVNPTRGDPWDRSELFVEATPWYKFNRMLKKVWCGFPGPNGEGKPLQLYDFH